jgi:hypothetical protein
MRVHALSLLLLLATTCGAAADEISSFLGQRL